MNYIEQIAKMLNVEINEEFKIEGYDDNMRFKFTRSAFLQSCGDGWWSSSNSIMNVLEGYRKLIKLPKPVLDEVEKEYLSYVIKPFRNRIKYFYKWACADCDTEIIMAVCKDHSYLGFPPFKKNVMYKGMVPNKKYTLDELGL